MGTYPLKKLQPKPLKDFRHWARATGILSHKFQVQFRSMGAVGPAVFEFLRMMEKGRDSVMDPVMLEIYL